LVKRLVAKSHHGTSWEWKLLMEWNLDTFTTEVNVCSHQGREGIQKNGWDVSHGTLEKMKENMKETPDWQVSFLLWLQVDLQMIHKQSNTRREKYFCGNLRVRYK